MGGFSASSKFQGKILQSLDSKSPLAPDSPVSESQCPGSHTGPLVLHQGLDSVHSEGKLERPMAVAFPWDTWQPVLPAE